MKKIVLALSLATAFVANPANAQKTLPGLDEQQTELLLCYTACQRAYNACRKENPLPNFKFWQLPSKGQLATGKLEVATLFGCQIKLNACFADCN